MEAGVDWEVTPLVSCKYQTEVMRWECWYQTAKYVACRVSPWNPAAVGSPSHLAIRIRGTLLRVRGMSRALQIGMERSTNAIAGLRTSHKLDHRSINLYKSCGVRTESFEGYTENFPARLEPPNLDLCPQKKKKFLPTPSFR